MITETSPWPRDHREHRLELSVTGPSSADGAAPLAVRLERLPGVLEALVNPITERAVVRFDPFTADTTKILDVLESLGIDARNRLARWHAPAPGCTCPGCQERLEATLGGLTGVEAVVLNQDEQSVTVEYVPSRSDQAMLYRALTTRPPSSCEVVDGHRLREEAPAMRRTR